VNREPIIDVHTHLYRTPEIGRQALQGLNRERTFFEWTGTVSDHLDTMSASGTDYAIAILVTPTREMREKAVSGRGSSEQLAPDASGIGLDQKLLGRLDRNNVWGCAAGQEHPQLLPFIHIDPDLQAGYDLANYVKNRVAEGAKGVKLLPLQNNFHGNDKRLWPMYEYLEGVGLPVFSQSGGGAINPRNGHTWARPAYFADALRDFPELNMILAHGLGGYQGSLDDALMLAESYTNVWFDTTVVTPRIGTSDEYSPEKVADLFRRVGVDHIAFGTNFPLIQYDRRKDIEGIKSLPLTDAEKRTIFYENAARILKLQLASE
jgi:predicted TIM-barrel fold metal-dependent hydrolase